MMQLEKLLDYVRYGVSLWEGERSNLTSKLDGCKLLFRDGSVNGLDADMI